MGSTSPRESPTRRISPAITSKGPPNSASIRSSLQVELHPEAGGESALAGEVSPVPAAPGGVRPALSRPQQCRGHDFGDQAEARGAALLEGPDRSGQRALGEAPRLQHRLGDPRGPRAPQRSRGFDPEPRPTVCGVRRLGQNSPLETKLPPSEGLSLGRNRDFTREKAAETKFDRLRQN